MNLEYEAGLQLIQEVKGIHPPYTENIAYIRNKEFLDYVDMVTFMCDHGAPSCHCFGDEPGIRA